MNPANPTPAVEEHFFNAHDGLRLFMRSWTVPGGRGPLAIVHGFAEHSGRYSKLAQELNAAGWSVAALDYRGHGQSGGRRAHIEAFDDYLNDIDGFLRELELAGAGGPVALLGHSQGGLIGARFAQRFPERVRLLVLSSPFFGMAMKVPALKMVAGRLVSRLLPALTMSTGLDSAWLSHDQAVVEGYASDPLVSHVATARWLTEVLQAQAQSLAQANLVQSPLLVLQAGQDRLTDIEATRQFFQSAGSADKQFEVYDGLFHEIFNELERSRVVADLLSWLERHA